MRLPKSRRYYYDFLSELANSSLFTSHFSLLSTTIRLHQLSMKVPPVDYGVLMLYNTGHPMKFMERNPILDIRDVCRWQPPTPSSSGTASYRGLTLSMWLLPRKL